MSSKVVVFPMVLMGCCAVACYAQSAPAAAAPDAAVVPRLASLSLEFKELARKVNPAVVRVTAIGYRQLEDDVFLHRFALRLRQIAARGMPIAR